MTSVEEDRSRPYDNGGSLPTGESVLRNDTGRTLYPHEWDQLTIVGPADNPPARDVATVQVELCDVEPFATFLAAVAEVHGGLAEVPNPSAQVKAELARLGAAIREFATAAPGAIVESGSV